VYGAVSLCCKVWRHIPVLLQYVGFSEISFFPLDHPRFACLPCCNVNFLCRAIDGVVCKPWYKPWLWVLTICNTFATVLLFFIDCSHSKVIITSPPRWLLSWSRDFSIQYFHRHGSRLGFEGYCLGLGLGLDSHCLGLILGFALTLLVLVYRQSRPRQFETSDDWRDVIIFFIKKLLKLCFLTYGQYDRCLHCICWEVLNVTGTVLKPIGYCLGLETSRESILLSWSRLGLGTQCLGLGLGLDLALTVLFPSVSIPLCL